MVAHAHKFSSTFTEKQTYVMAVTSFDALSLCLFATCVLLTRDGTLKIFISMFNILIEGLLTKCCYPLYNYWSYKGCCRNAVCNLFLVLLCLT